jgi:RNA polymerase sigma-70 factor (ECF subfamily)
MDPLSRSRLSCVTRSSRAAEVSSTGRGTLQRGGDVHGFDVLGFAAIERGSPSGGESQAAPGDSLDFQQVYEEHFDFVWRSLRLLGVADELVEDALQDTFSVVYRQLARFEGRSSLRTWIFAILHRVAANHRRTRKRKQRPLEPFVEMAGGDAPDAHAEAVEAARMIERFCASLAPARRALFVLAVLEELPAAEVAATLGLPVSKVYSRVHALREGLRHALAAPEVERG